MATVVLDSSNVEAVLNDARGVKPEVKEEAKAEAVETPPEQIEDEDGLTIEQKRELTGKMLKAIGKKHRALKEAEEFAAEQYSSRRTLEQKLQLYEKELSDLRSQPKEPAKPAQAPKREDFKTDIEYQDAVIDWRVDQRLKAQREADEKAAAEKRTAEILKTAEERLNKARELVEDFDDVIGAIDTPVPPYIAAYMQRSPLFAELGYYFAQHPDVLERLSSLPPEDALVEVGEIKSTLKPFAPKAKANGHTESKANGTAPRQEEKTDTAPRRVAPVIRPLATGSDSQVEKNPHDRNYSEERVAWEKKNRTNLARRSRH